MRETDRNPKDEIRRPKEGRNPKAEVGARREIGGMDGDFWTWGDEVGDGAMVLREEADKKLPPEDLGERTARFGEAIIGFAKRIPQNPVNNRLISQLVGACTSVGANYCEADDAVSAKEFKQRIGTSRKESKESMFFLRMVATAEPTLAAEARKLWREAKELNPIFGSIWRKRL
jgi:four helix bundle protein